MLAEFPSVIDAVNCAVAMQQIISAAETDVRDEDRIRYRIGINSGDVVVDGDDVQGDGVNVASRLEQLADPDGICISGAAYDQMRSKVDIGFELLGDVQVKNIDRPIQAYRVLNDSGDVGKAVRTAKSTSGSRSPKTIAALVATFIAVLAIGAWAWFQWGDSGKNGTPVVADTLNASPAIAVLPLDDLSNGDNKGYLSDALSEGIITELARFPQFKVIARNSSFQFRDSPTDIREIGKTLGVDYVLEGSQQYDGENVRVTIQLIEAKSGTHIFANKLDRKIEDLFKLQDEIVGIVSSKIGGTLIDYLPEKRVAGEVSSSLRSLQARKMLQNFSRENWEKALALEQISVREDPESPWGYIGTALGLRVGARLGWVDRPRDEVEQEAFENSKKALALGPNNYMSHYAHARVLASLGRTKDSLRHFERAGELNPSDSKVLVGMSVPLLYTGQTERAIANLQRARSVDPLHGHFLLQMLGWAYWQNNECEKGLEEILSMSRPSASSRTMVAALYVCVGNLKDANVAMGEFLKKWPDRTLSIEAERVKKEWTDKKIRKRWLNDMRLAGMPE